jgi:hypothetical protein
MANDLLTTTDYLQSLYLLRLNQTKVDRACNTTTAAAQPNPHDTLEYDTDVFDVSTAMRIGDHPFAFEVQLTGRGARLFAGAEEPARSEGTIVDVPPGVAGSVVDVMTSSATPPPTRAVVLWNTRSSIYPTRRIILHSWSLHLHDTATRGRAYDWTVVAFDPTKVAMRLGTLRDETRRLNVPGIFTACTKPNAMAHLLVEMERHHAITDVHMHYVSFRLSEASDDSVSVNDITIHPIVWATRTSPDTTITAKIERLVQGKPRLQAFIEKLRGKIE